MDSLVSHEIAEMPQTLTSRNTEVPDRHHFVSHGRSLPCSTVELDPIRESGPSRIAIHGEDTKCSSDSISMAERMFCLRRKLKATLVITEITTSGRDTTEAEVAIVKIMENLLLP
jgi:hypothetical protein